jgi:upstream activation factor subunit UAF30
MDFDIHNLEPHIRRILSAPGTDLSTISAKRVRKQIVELEPSLTHEFLRQNREAVDGVITRVFEAVTEEVGGFEVRSQGSEEGADRASVPRKKRKEKPDLDEFEDDDETPPPKKPKKGVNARTLSDAELARQLSSEINGRSRRSSTGVRARTTNGSAKKGSKKKKSAALVESDGDESDEDDDSGKPKPKRKSTGTAKGGFAREYFLSAPLATLLNMDKLSRPQVVKHLWDYIKGNELQNPRNKREIMCDPGLKAVFGVEKIDMFRMNKVLGQHLHDEE